MDTTLTISTRSFVRGQDPKGGGSLRINTTDGVNTPEVMTVKHMEATDSATKGKVRRSLLRIDKTIDGGDGTLPIVSAQLVVVVPKHAGVTSAHILAAVERIVNVIQEDDTGLDLADEIFVNQEV